MNHIASPTGVSLSYDKVGNGPPLVLVHGGFSDHRTNWEFVKPLLRDHFTLYAVARRGRGETDATEGHSLADEGRDVAALIRSLPDPVFLLGHSYGGQCALAAALEVPEQIRKLILYEPPWPSLMSDESLAYLEGIATRDGLDAFATAFFRDVLRVPVRDLDEMKQTELWAPIVDDAKASLGDVRALNRHPFDPQRCRELRMPTLLQVGSESPRDLWVTDALLEVLPNVRLGELAGQAHEGMTTAPEMYAAAVIEFLNPAT